jgi:peptidoglycan/xylan/chitin deacetylase (PgdA/CDA1 family)
MPYGDGLYSCLEPGTVAITFDDGPYIYINNVLDQFAAYRIEASFFLTGINLGKGAIDDMSRPWSALISRMIAEGHQVASHTWSGQDLSTLTTQQRYDQIIKNEMAISNVIGKFPTYLRPSYNSCNADFMTVLGALGYVVAFFDQDTDGCTHLRLHRVLVNSSQITKTRHLI